MNIANLLTLSRMVLAPVYLVLLISDDVTSRVAALIVFTLAAFTDLFDGRVARARGEVTAFGKFMDPLADKVLVVSGMMALSILGVIQYWFVAVIVLRELFVTGLRSYVAGRGQFIKPSMLARSKTFLQMGVVIIGTASLTARSVMLSWGVGWSPDYDVWITTGINALMWVAVAVTLWTGVSYLWRSRELLKDEIRK